MGDPYLKSLLGEREEIILVAHRHWYLLLQQIWPELSVIAITLGGISLSVFVLAGGLLAAFGYFLVIIPLVSLIRDYVVWDSHKYVVTSRRVIQIFGVFNKNVTDSSLEKVNDVLLQQSFVGRLIGFGDIEILTASEMGINRFTQISNPVRFKTAMLNAKTKLEHAPAAQDDVASLLVKIEALRQAGVLTQKEFDKKKGELLKRK